MKANKIILKHKRLLGEDKSIVISLRIKAEMLTSLDNIAQKIGFSRNKLANKLLDYALERVEIQDEIEN